MNALEPQLRSEGSRILLQDLYDLLEAYAPTWYSAELHNRLVAQLMTAEPTSEQCEAEANLTTST
jgi:hypothetical protein